MTDDTTQNQAQEQALEQTRERTQEMAQEQTRSQLLLVPTKVLLIVAGAVWLLAGAIVASVGIKAATEPWTAWMAVGMLIVFAVFLVMFLLISRRHVRRILSYTSRLSFLFRFFNAGSYIIMFVMIFLGTAVRISTFVPDDIIAFFYSGLGAALILSGFYLFINYIRIWDSPRFH